MDGVFPPHIIRNKNPRTFPDHFKSLLGSQLSEPNYFYPPILSNIIQDSSLSSQIDPSSIQYHCQLQQRSLYNPCQLSSLSVPSSRRTILTFCGQFLAYGHLKGNMNVVSSFVRQRAGNDVFCVVPAHCLTNVQKKANRQSLSMPDTRYKM